MKKVLAIILSLVMLFTCSGVAVLAQSSETDETVAVETTSGVDLTPIIRPIKNISFASVDTIGDSLLKAVYGVVDVLIDVIVGAINSVVPSKDFSEKDIYETDNFYQGYETFLSSAAPNAQWSLGYASASIQTGNELDGNHMVGGSLDLDKSATEIYDDQRVRVISIDDGSGRGAVVFACVDAFGLALPDVREIRERIVYFAKANGIASVNVSVLHQHSCVDTYGMNANLVEAILKNPIINMYNNITGSNVQLVTGKNDEFMENLFNVATDAIVDAYNNMEPGKLYFSETDISEFVRDKREPMVADSDLNRLRFVPDNKDNNETWLVNGPIHCVGAGAGTTTVTGDYPYYMEQYIKEKTGANFMLLLGAELAISSQYEPIQDKVDGMSRVESLAVFGEALGEKLVNSNAPETEVEPLLNIRFNEYTIPVTNKILVFAAKMGIVTNLAVSNNDNDTDIEVVTEIGYMELGDSLAVALIPGELEAAIAYGGALDETNSYRNESWDYPSMQEIVGDRELLVFGLMNDQVGYILTDNDYSSIIAGVNEEIVATGDKAGSCTITAFQELVNSVK